MVRMLWVEMQWAAVWCGNTLGLGCSGNGVGWGVWTLTLHCLSFELAKGNFKLGFIWFHIGVHRVGWGGVG